MTALSIRNMNWTTGQMEQIREAAEVERRQKRERERWETNDLLSKISDFFPFSEAGQLAFGDWVDAGPDDNAGFLQYCRAEWALIVSEIEFAHKLAGHSFIVHQNAASVSTLGNE